MNPVPMPLQLQLYMCVKVIIVSLIAEKGTFSGLNRI